MYFGAKFESYQQELLGVIRELAMRAEGHTLERCQPEGSHRVRADSGRWLKSLMQSLLQWGEGKGKRNVSSFLGSMRPFVI